MLRHIDDTLRRRGTASIWRNEPSKPRTGSSITRSVSSIRHVESFNYRNTAL